MDLLDKINNNMISLKREHKMLTQPEQYRKCLLGMYTNLSQCRKPTKMEYAGNEISSPWHSMHS